MIFALIRTIDLFFTILYIMLFARIILSWFPMANNRLLDLLYAFTEPVLAPIRKLVHRSPLGGPGMVLDFSPLIAFILIRLVNNFLTNFLRGFL
ncbi:MAG: YggT family protein [Defluviitaleaceae bacterium]|nr:YggT family protein [Defluviitaleaceae bacterium]